jgi:tetratricopeptide (TPR) repeat protein
VIPVTRSRFRTTDPTRASNGLGRSEAMSSNGSRDREQQMWNEANRARNLGKHREAIRLYRTILVENPNHREAALRLAPMLAVEGESFEAWQLYRRVALEHARDKQYFDCLGVYREACRFVPGEFEAWRLCADLLVKLKRHDEAFEALLDGRTHFTHSHHRAQAIALLTRAREIEPWDGFVLLDLARLYSSRGQSELALELLANLACRVEGRDLRRVRWLQFTLTLSARHFFLWTKSFLVARGPEEEIDDVPTLSLIDPVDDEDEAERREAPHLRSVGGESL